MAETIPEPIPGPIPGPILGPIPGLPQRVGFVGLGRMGEPMVRRLAAAGIEIGRAHV